MRKEATIEQWKELYEAATRIKEMKPQHKFWDLDIIGIREGNEEDTTFYSILGHGGDCYGLLYMKDMRTKRFLMPYNAGAAKSGDGYVMFSQNNLTCYWGNREESTNKQRKNIKEMGYKYRGKNQWLYFLLLRQDIIPII